MLAPAESAISSCLCRDKNSDTPSTSFGQVGQPYSRLNFAGCRVPHPLISFWLTNPNRGVPHSPSAAAERVGENDVGDAAFDCFLFRIWDISLRQIPQEEYKKNKNVDWFLDFKAGTSTRNCSHPRRPPSEPRGEWGTRYMDSLREVKTRGWGTQYKRAPFQSSLQ